MEYKSMYQYHAFLNQKDIRIMLAI